jgi:NAD(P)-dependent dehydrogenase (short-subunit alcohol dehydrogenase family)
MRAIVTGAASGIGLAVAQRINADNLAREGKGARLVLADLQAQRLDEAACDLRAAGAEVVTIVGNLVDPELSPRIVELSINALGGIDALISNAGLLRPGNLLDLSIEDYELTFAVNTRPTWLLGRAAHPHLKESKGSIVATASIAGHHPIPSQGAYSASKAALLMLVRQMACDWGQDGIRVNSVSPGSTLTGISGSEIDRKVTEPGGAPGRNPLNFISEPRDQAAMIAFLVSPDARFITGADFAVDGGVRTQLMVKSGHPITR